MAVRQMKLGLSTAYYGYHLASWRLPEFPRDGMWNIRSYIHVAHEAERGLFDFIFFADVLASEQVEDPIRFRRQGHGMTRLDPLQVLAAIAVSTQRLGLIPTINATYHHPFTVARAIATLDHISNGRAGWNIVTGNSAAAARNYGLTEEKGSQERYAVADEFIQVVRGLWDSWEDDAFPVNQGTGEYVDRTKLHTLDHEGRFFKVRGPLNVPRPPQGHPVLVSAGASEQGVDLAAKYCDAVYTGNFDIATGQGFYRAVKDRMATYGRDAGGLSVLPAVQCYVAESESEARGRVRMLQDLLTPELALAVVYDNYGDLSHYRMDEPLPDDAPCFDPDWGKGSRTSPTFARSMQFLRTARKEGLTLRQICEAYMFGEAWRMMLVGTPKQVVDTMERWFHEGAADGFNVQAAYAPGSVTAFVNLVVPELQRRGLFRTRYGGDTLRDHFGLERPAHPSLRKH